MILVFSAFVLLVMFCMAAFSIDIGYIVLVRAQLQNAADAASLAGVLELGTTANADDAKTNAVAEAIKVAGYNIADGRNVYLTDDDVIVGLRDGDGDIEWEGGGPYNAVRAIPKRDNQGGAVGTDDPLDLWFADFVFAYFGKTSYKAPVRGDAKAYLAPRDMVFVIDRSGSMSNDSSTLGSGATDIAMARPMVQSWFGSTTTWRGTRNQYTSSFPSGSGDTPYQTLYTWVTATAQKTFDSSKTGSKLTQAQWFAQEMPISEISGGSAGQHYKHWRWKAYCDYLFNRSNTDNAGTGINSSHQKYFGIYTYVNWASDNGYAPAYIGQKFLRRSSSTDYQTYPIPAADTTDAWKSYYSGGVYDTIMVKPIAYARRACLAAIEEIAENTYPGAENQDMAGFVTYGTKATKDMLMKSDMGLVQRAAANFVNGSKVGSTSAMTGITNTHMGLVYGYEVIAKDAGSRAYSNKVIVLMSDGVCNVYGTTSVTYTGDSPGNLTATANAKAIAAAKTARDNNCRIHVIGLGDGQDPVVMKAIADAGGGTYFSVGEDGTVEEDELTAVFVSIAQDRLGKFFTD